MTVLAAATVLSLATSCQLAAFGDVLVGPSLIRAMAEGESGFGTRVVRHNQNGTWDVGLMQINTSNFAKLGLDWRSAMGPCRSIQAGVAVLLSRYNTGSNTRGIANGYARGILARVHPEHTGPPMPQRLAFPSFACRKCR